MQKLQFRVLFRQFLFRMVDLEVLSAQARGDAGRLYGQFATLLIAGSILFTIPVLGAYRPMTRDERFIFTWSHQHFLIATTMLAVGLFAVLSWDTTFRPPRRSGAGAVARSRAYSLQGEACRCCKRHGADRARARTPSLGCSGRGP